MKQRILTAVIFILIIAIFMIPGYFSIWPPALLFMAVGLITASEITNALRHRYTPCKTLIMGGVLFGLIPILIFLYQPVSGPLNQLFCSLAVTLYTLMIYLLITTTARLLIDGPRAFPDAVVTGAGTLYIAFPLASAMTMLTQLDDGWLWLMIGLCSPWISDTFSYFVGSLFGRHAIVPALSPKKTIEGSIGGVLGCMLFQMLIFYLFRNILSAEAGSFRTVYYLFSLLTGFLLSASSQFGDWLASGFKRFCGIKDFGKILPGHGGLMDRFDSVYFTLPVTLGLAVLFQVVEIRQVIA